eukprot:303504-Rhodomonas_salina.5
MHTIAVRCSLQQATNSARSGTNIQENAYGKNHDLVVRMRKQRDCLKAKGIQVSVPELPLHDGNQAPVAMQEPQSHTPASVSAGSSALREPRTLAVTPVRLSHAIDEPHFANDFALDSAMSLRKLSAQFMAENKYDRALAKAEEALAILESSFPTKHVEFARIYRAIGEAMFSQGRLQESLSKYTTSLAYITKESNDDRLEEATINLHIGRALKEMGSYNDALVSMDTAMNMQIEELGLRSLEVAHTIDEMSLVSIPAISESAIPAAEQKLHYPDAVLAFPLAGAQQAVPLR